MGGLSTQGVEPSRIASVEHTFMIPGRSTAGKAGPSGSMPPGGESGGQKLSAASVRGSGGIRRRKEAAMVGSEPSPEAQQGAAADDEIVGAEDIDEVLIVRPRVRE